jgi:hypothetical protein
MQRSCAGRNLALNATLPGIETASFWHGIEYPFVARFTQLSSRESRSTVLACAAGHFPPALGEHPLRWQLRRQTCEVASDLMGPRARLCKTASPSPGGSFDEAHSDDEYVAQ